jgi:choice-of-anchor A domain-containing protein
MNVFSLDGADITGPNISIDINTPTNSTVLINVSGSGQNFVNGQINLNGLDPSQVLFNFYESTEITITSYKMNGSFLAAWADVTGNNGQFNGQMIAESFEGSMEFHNVMFDGNITTVPIPAAFWLFGSAFGFLSVLGRRKNRVC